MRAKFKEWFSIIITFTITLYFYAYISYFGLKDFIIDGTLKEYLNTNLWHIELIIAAVFMGSYFILINKLTDRPAFRRKSYGFNILLKSALYLASLVTVGVFIYYFFLVAEFATVEQMETYKELFSSRFLISFLMFYGAFIFLLNFFLYINRKFGPGILMDLMTGKYYHPRNEELILLFIDLRGSTTISEILGHNKYSRFLKECLHELTPVIQKHQASIYQYVGDEVVLYWEKRKGMDLHSCLKVFFEFNHNLLKKKDHFISEYGKMPEFKGGMDLGIVTTTEIGDIKREIAFHGDALNTASRLEGKCNEYGERLIVSQHIVDQFDKNTSFDFRFLSDFPLRGKEEKLKFYGVRST